MKNFARIAIFIFGITNLTNSLHAEDEEHLAKLATIQQSENAKLKRLLVEKWQQLNAAEIKSVKVKLGSFHGFADHKTTFEANIQDKKLLGLFQQGLKTCLVDPPQPGFGGFGLSPNGVIEIQGTKGEQFELVFHLYPSHDAKEPAKPGMMPGFGFMTIGPSTGGLQTVYSPGWAMFLNEVFTLNNKPKLSEHAFNKLSGKYWLESSLKEAEETLGINTEVKQPVKAD